MNISLIVLIIIIFVCVFSSLKAKEEFSWSRITYKWPERHEAEEESIFFPGRTNSINRRHRRPHTRKPQDSQSYIYENNIPMAANLWNNKLFISVPRRRPGIPSTLNYVWVNETERHNVPLVPYPDWASNTLGRGEGKIVSVYRVAIDSCDRMWFVDTGRIETPGQVKQVQPSALVILDLKSDLIIRRHVLDASLLESNSTLANLAVDIGKQGCGDAFAYIPDLGGYSLFVYSFKENKSWRLKHDYFSMEPSGDNFSVGGFNYSWKDGIFSLGLSDFQPGGYRSAYFHSLAGFSEYRVSTKALRNEKLASNKNSFQLIGNRGTQASASDLHKRRGVLFFGLVNQNSLACWNIERPLSDVAILRRDDERMIYPSDLKISGDNVVLLTNNMPVFIYGKLNYNVTNFRVWIENADAAVRGTKCDKKV